MIESESAACESLSRWNFDRLFAVVPVELSAERGSNEFSVGFDSSNAIKS